MMSRGGYGNGKEGRVRETQEGCPSPLKSFVFETLKKLQKRERVSKKFFRHTLKRYEQPLIPLKVFYSNSTVAGGLEVTSYSTRLMWGTSPTMRPLTLSSSS